MKISDILKHKKSTLSYEFFPPKDEEDMKKLFSSASELMSYRPDFFSVTYGAGGSTRGRTLEIAEGLQKRFRIPVMHHLTIIGHKKDELIEILDEMRRRGIRNVLALRGDPPKDNTGTKDVFYEMNHTYQLIDLIRRRYQDYFSIGVAGFCESYQTCPDRKDCDRFLKMKIESGADFVITQLFYAKEEYFQYVRKLRGLGLETPVLTGILPIADAQKVLSFAKSCGVRLPEDLKALFDSEYDEKQRHEDTNHYMIRLVSDLLAKGADGIHFYTLNRADKTREILEGLKEEKSKQRVA